jgi:hypothetical protein
MSRAQAPQMAPWMAIVSAIDPVPPLEIAATAALDKRRYCCRRGKLTPYAGTERRIDTHSILPSLEDAMTAPGVRSGVFIRWRGFGHHLAPRAAIE